MFFPYNSSDQIKWQGYQNSAGAVIAALNLAKENYSILNEIEVTYSWIYNECVMPTAMGNFFEMITSVNESIDVMFGPACSETAPLCGNIAAYYNFPIFLYGLSSVFTSFEDVSLYPTVVTVMPSYKDGARGLAKILQNFAWYDVALIYMQSTKMLRKCEKFANEVDSVISNDIFNVRIAYKRIITNFSASNLANIANTVKKLSRIFIICLDEQDKFRSLMLAFYDSGMNNNEYVYINTDVNLDYYINSENQLLLKDYNIPPDGRDNDTYSMYDYILHFQYFMTGGMSSYYNEFRTNMPTYMKQSPFNCTTECEMYNVSSIYAPYLFDTAYVYYACLAKMMVENDNKIPFNELIKNGQLIANYSIDTFQGITGEFSINKLYIRNSLLALGTYYNFGQNVTNWIEINVNDGIANLNLLYTDPSTTIWKSRNGKQPLNEPKCGYKNTLCPYQFIQQNSIGFAFTIIGGVILIILIILIFVCLYIQKKREEEKQNDMWKISYHSLIKYEDYEKSASLHQSRKSIASGKSSTKLSEKFNPEGRHRLFVYKNEYVMGRIHSCPYILNKSDMAHLRHLRMLNNDNVNKLIGFSLNAPTLMSIWKFCSRGSIANILTDDNLKINIDGVFIYSLIKDTVEGLYFIHNSPIEIHGNLSSRNCLINERWQVKLSDYGLPFLRIFEEGKPEHLLWTAPEVLRYDISYPNKESDIYSLAIVLSDLINKGISFDNNNIEGGVDEVIYMLKNKRSSPFRPNLDPAVEDIPSAMLHLIKDMWSEDPSLRPKINVIKKLIKQMKVGKKSNLMDHVYSMLENYATSLEEDIQNRTKELMEEKKKADLLLSKMLPKAVAEKLKSGQTIAPEHFDLVTIFFSDVVSFTTLASKCTALQVVDLMNGLYTIFDSTISEHDVYKVETIGDGYLCVSGLPERNGNNHVKEIANLSLELLKQIPKFKIGHLPNEEIRIRVGMHSGPCVAGVVGLTMPRYCLFGDTVNTASRMESNGKPNHIHMSSDAHKLLTEKIGGFVTEPRGEVLIKGKGVMETYWLLGKTGEVKANSNNGMYTDYRKDSMLYIALLLPDKNPNAILWQGYQNSAAAAVQAWYLAKENYTNLRGINISFEIILDDCIISETVGDLREIIVTKNISAIFGPPCSETCTQSSHLAVYYNLPMYLFGTSMFTDMSDISVFSTIMQVMPSYTDSAKGLAEVLTKFEWNQVSLIYMNSLPNLSRCHAFAVQLDYQLYNFYQNIDVVYKRMLTSFEHDVLESMVKAINEVSRINIICIDEMDKLRNVMLAFFDNGMNKSDYVYINVDADMDGYINQEGINAMKDYNITPDGRDKDAYSMYDLMYHYQFSQINRIPGKYDDLRTNMKKYMKEWPFYCYEECEQYNVSSVYAPYLHDTAYIYYSALSKALDLYGDQLNFYDIVNDGKLISNMSIGYYVGATGKFQIDTNLVRNSLLSFSNYIDNGENISRRLLVKVYNNIRVEIETIYTNEKDTIWATRNGIKPLSVPLCGFLNENCQKSYMHYLKIKEEEKIGFHSLIKHSDSKNSSSIALSKRSVNSSISNQSKMALHDKKDGKHQFFILNNIPVVGRVHNCYYVFSKKDMAYIRNIIMVDSENINKLVGFCLDGPTLLSLWNYCSRGCLIDIITNDNLNINIDGFFIYSLIKDIVEGLYVMHNSAIEYHGNLSSKNCLVDERWQVKLSDYGFPFLRCLEEPKSAREQLWTAPELLRNKELRPNQSSDIYSLSIVMADLVNKNISFENSDVQKEADEIIYLLKNRNSESTRPTLNPAVENINGNLLHLIRDMWAEDPSRRPKISVIRKLINDMNETKSKNLMDHMYDLLENYAASLEEDIQHRTKELMEEKKKADLLLSRMLPKAVAEKLKLGQPIAPEHFDSVTIFFSDVVSFTTLASKCTALQVVDLMNGLYTIFDSTINEHDVYKVETIGDGYLCVSGLPERNENRHITEIASLSLELIKRIPEFKITHLPNEKIRIRVGINSGPCVAGVVGLTMPRYCLFGDTVNTASRMESNGKPSHIHMSKEAHELLKNVGGFVTEPRGEVVIKGKGVMETYWLLGKIGGISINSSNEM
uniref:Guanylate cyclase n=2 Tax=Strongyloides stercoralis TaxID=6248 RepID=A0AAF5D150_STRER